MLWHKLDGTRAESTTTQIGPHLCLNTRPTHHHIPERQMSFCRFQIPFKQFIISFWMQSSITQNIMNVKTCPKSIRRERDETKTLLFVNMWSYNEQIDASYIPKIKKDFHTFLSLTLCWCFEERERSFVSSDFWVLASWQVTHFQFLLVFQDGRPSQSISRE